MIHSARSQCHNHSNATLIPENETIPICIQSVVGAIGAPHVWTPPIELLPVVTPQPRKRRPFWRRLGRAVIGFTLHALAIPVHLGMGLCFGGILSVWSCIDLFRESRNSELALMCAYSLPAGIIGFLFSLVLPLKTFVDRMEDKEDIPFWYIWPWGIDAE